MTGGRALKLLAIALPACYEYSENEKGMQEVMPKGSPTVQTKASEKYQKKMGIIVKGFKMKRELAEEFKATCDKIGVAQSSVIVEFMQQFVNNNK